MAANSCCFFAWLAPNPPFFCYNKYTPFLLENYQFSQTLCFGEEPASPSEGVECAIRVQQEPQTLLPLWAYDGASPARMNSKDLHRSYKEVKP